MIVTDAPGLCPTHHLELSSILRDRMREYMKDIGYPTPTASGAGRSPEEARRALEVDLSAVKGRVH